ncbi:MAG: hypothetical protein HOW59_22800, partial [Nonomuraea sp.]|nr:hypothetical protein [Nonomuraea sp.]
AEPPVVDVSVSRRMGLFVVGRLALRHGIRVQLRKGEGAGLIAMVLLPPTLIADGTQQPLPQRPAFGGGTVPPPAPSQNGAFRSFASFDSIDANGARPPLPPLPDSARFGQGPSSPAPFDSGPPSFESGPARQGFGAFNSDPGRPVNGFTADTDGGSYRRQPPSFESGAYPSLSSGTGSFPSYPAANENSFPTPPPYGTSYGTNDVRRPEPTPSVEVSPMEPEQEEFLPIFASVESAWFRRPPGEPAPEQPPRAAQPGGEARPAQAVPSGEEAWQTAADAGWRAAAKASEPSLGGMTAAGLPKRTPKANLVPGTASQPAQQQAAQPQPKPPVPPVSPDRMRSRMASYQQGVRRGRQEVRGQEEQSE